MLSLADADLARRDRALPGLAILFDADEFAARLGRALDSTNLTAAVTYVKYQPGRNCLVGYQLRVGSALVPVYAIAHRRDASHKLDKARLQPGTSGLLGSGRIAIDD